MSEKITEEWGMEWAWNSVMPPFRVSFASMGHERRRSQNFDIASLTLVSAK
jgi:hypothetical protein